MSRAVAGTPGFPLAIARVLTELRLASLSRDEIVGVVPELAPIIAGYESELSDAALTDWPGTLQLATEVASKTKPDRLIGLPTLLLDVSVATEAESQFIRALAGKAPEVLATAAVG